MTKTRLVPATVWTAELGTTTPGVCPRCSAFLHCCRNCDFYAPGLANDCREPRAEHVVDKEQANFCDWFRPAPTPRPAATSASGARAALDALFAKKPDREDR